MKWNYFELAEFKCRCGKCVGIPMDEDFVTALDDLRGAFRRSLRINSGYRCPAWNVRQSTTGEAGPHTTGRAVDIGISRLHAFELIELIGYRNLRAMELTERRIFTGIGIKQHGNDRFIHLDNLETGRPTTWSY